MFCKHHPIQNDGNSVFIMKQETWSKRSDSCEISVSFL